MGHGGVDRQEKKLWAAEVGPFRDFGPIFTVERSQGLPPEALPVPLFCPVGRGRELVGSSTRFLPPPPPPQC